MGRQASPHLDRGLVFDDHLDVIQKLGEVVGKRIDGLPYEGAEAIGILMVGHELEDMPRAAWAEPRTRFPV